MKFLRLFECLAKCYFTRRKGHRGAGGLVRSTLRLEPLEQRQLLSVNSGLLSDPAETVDVLALDAIPANPDFSLLDVNTSSPSYNQPVSPRDYLQQVSGWYFAHAT